MINIEVKAPHDDDVKTRYDYKLCIKKVYEHIQRYDVMSHCIISSFDEDVLQELERLNQQYNTVVRYYQLYNFYEHLELPDPSIYTDKGSGINISSTKLTQEVIDNCHSKGKKVGVWVNKDAFVEDDKFYENAIKLGVDFICTDYPLEATKVKQS